MTTWISWRGPRSASSPCRPVRRRSPTRPTRPPTSILATPPVYNDVVGNEESRQLDQVNLFIDHSFGAADFRSSTSWRQFDTVNREDEDGTNLIGTYFDTANIEDNESFYQEFKFSGETARIDWVGGVSYYNEKADQISDTHTYTDAIDTLGVNLGIWDSLGIPFPLYAGTSSFTEPFGVSMLGLPWREAMYNRGDFEAIAAFGDVIWHVNDKTNLTFGLRYTHDNKKFTWINGPHETPELDQIVAGLEQAGFFTMFPIPPEAYRFSDIVFAVDTPAGGVTQEDSWRRREPASRARLQDQLRTSWCSARSPRATRRAATTASRSDRSSRTRTCGTSRPASRACSRMRAWC